MPMKPIRVKSALPAETCGDDALRRAHQAIDEPRLAADFRGDPAGRGGDIREGQHQHQQPEQRPRVIEPAAPEAQRRAPLRRSRSSQARP